MCCLFGLLDIRRSLSAKEKAQMLSILGTICETRGVDATGYSYVHKEKLIIKKKAVPAHEMCFHIPDDVFVIMGHTRMTTQGSARKCRNNHPFLGKTKNSHFALAHNGILANDKTLRQTENLPKTKIETDSYAAVQLIEKENTLDFHSLKKMAEKVKGTFSFTVMDQKGQLYFIKGNNPMCIYWFPEEGFYIYASTKAILDTALGVMGRHALVHEEIPITDGDIIKIDAQGMIFRDCFQLPIAVSKYEYWYEDLWVDWEPVAEEPTGYRKYIMDYGAFLGIPQKELDHLHHFGLSDTEMEECIYSRDFRKMLLLETGYYYNETEGFINANDDYFENLPWSDP